MVAGSILFFIFRQQTSAHYFTQIAYYGGAKYIATGRGFDLTHTPYTKLFSMYGRSHIYFGYQLALMALMLALLNVPNYFLSTWGTWLVAISLTYAPIWFNPQTFIVNVAWDDFKAWRDWMLGSIDVSVKSSWCAASPTFWRVTLPCMQPPRWLPSMSLDLLGWCRGKWHQEQLEKARNVSGKQTDHFYNRLGGVLMQLFNTVILIAVLEFITRPDCQFRLRDGTCLATEDGSGSRKVIGVIVFEVFVFGLLALAGLQQVMGQWNRKLRRLSNVIAVAGFIVLFFLFIGVFGRSSGAGVRDLVLLIYANFIFGTIIVQLWLYIAPFNAIGVSVVNNGYYAADTAIGLTTFLFIFLLSIIPLVDSIQSLLLFNKDVLSQSHVGRQTKQVDQVKGYAGQREAVRADAPMAPNPVFKEAPTAELAGNGDGSVRVPLMARTVGAMAPLRNSIGHGH